MIAEGWDVDKASAHLADLRQERAFAEAKRDAFIEAADRFDREVDRLSRQIGYCEDMFSKPREVQGK